MRILLIEDDPTFRSVLKHALEERGEEVFEAAHGKNALGVFAAVFPDLAILDIGIPYATGDQLAAEFKQFNSRCKVVAISGSAEKLETARLSGADATLLKPFELDEILSTISRLAPGK